MHVQLLAEIMIAACQQRAKPAVSDVDQVSDGPNLPQGPFAQSCHGSTHQPSRAETNSSWSVILCLLRMWSTPNTLLTLDRDMSLTRTSTHAILVVVDLEPSHTVLVH